MTKAWTGNPIGSNEIGDLLDNAENLDLATNDVDAETWVDRFSRERRSWFGIEQRADRQHAEINVRFEQFLVAWGQAVEYAARVPIVPHPLISDTVMFKKGTNGPTKVHFEPMGRIESGTASKWDLMGENLQLVKDVIDTSTEVTSYRIRNCFFSTSSPRGANGIAVDNVKARGHQFGVWPEWMFAFQDASAAFMKAFYFDTSEPEDTIWSTPFRGMWWPGLAVNEGDYCVFSQCKYRAIAAGVTGAMGPAHKSGTQSDGGVNWEFVRDYSASISAIQPMLLIGATQDMPKRGFPNSRLQVSRQAVIWNGVKLSFLNPDNSVSFEIQARQSDGKMMIASPDGSKYLVFDPVTGDFVFSGSRIAPRVRSITGTETVIDITDIDVVRLVQPEPTSIVRFSGGRPYQRITLFASNGNTTLKNGAQISLKGGQDLALAATRAIDILMNGTGASASEIGS